jgi:hypothetical protein
MVEYSDRLILESVHAAKPSLSHLEKAAVEAAVSS